MGERCRLARITAWVAKVVRVMPQAICGMVIWVVRKEKGEGGSSPCCISRLAQSMVRQGLDLQFQLEGTNFVPFHQLGFQQPYQMYFDLQPIPR